MITSQGERKSNYLKSVRVSMNSVVYKGVEGSNSNKYLNICSSKSYADVRWDVRGPEALLTKI